MAAHIIDPASTGPDGVDFRTGTSQGRDDVLIGRLYS
jgi:hypothetical protein